MERMDTLKDILCRLQMVLLELKQQAKLRRELEAKYREKMEWHRSMRKGPLKMVSSGREINQLKIELQLKETSPLQATDLDGPSSLITNSVFSKGFGHLPYAFCNLPRTPHVPMCRYPQFSDEASRLRTFRQNWCHGLDPGQLAASGFFYTGPNDLVRCFWCGVGFKDWTPGDNPWYQHIKLSRNCGFPESALNPEDLHAYKEQIRAEQTPSQRGLLGTQGVNDSVRLFHCNGGMRNWDDGADPWMEHARWFPSCGFVRQQKGDEYIRLVQLASDDEDGAAAQSPEIVRSLQTMALNEPMESSRSPHATNLPTPAGLPTPRRTITTRTWMRESENPIYCRPAQAVINMGFSRDAVTMAIEECFRNGIVALFCKDA